VSAGNDSIGMASLATMALAAGKGMPLVAISGFAQKSPDAVIALKGSGITQPRDVEGKRWGVVPDASYARSFPAFAAANGINMDTIVMIQVSSSTMYSALLQNNVDFVTGWASGDALNIAQQKPIEPPIVFADHGLNILGSGLIVTTEMASRNGRMLRGFLAATVRGAEEAERSPEAGIEAIMQARPLIDRAILADQARRIGDFRHTKNTKGHSFGWMARADWEETQEVLEKYFDLPPGLDIDRLYTNEFLPKH
jgi:NitT/TauT family transport system substrate-binding protein